MTVKMPASFHVLLKVSQTNSLVKFQEGACFLFHLGPMRVGFNQHINEQYCYHNCKDKFYIFAVLKLMMIYYYHDHYYKYFYYYYYSHNNISNNNSNRINNRNNNKISIDAFLLGTNRMSFDYNTNNSFLLLKVLVDFNLFLKISANDPLSFQKLKCY